MMAPGRIAAFLAVAALMAGCSAAAPTTPTATNRPCIVAVYLVGPPVPGAVSLLCRSCSIGFGSDGGQSTAYVETEAACAWTAASDQGWTTVAPSAGSGSGAVRISAPANPASNRASHVTIAATTIDVNQAGATPCTFSIAPLSVSMSSAGGTAAVTQTASGNGCQSVVESDASWVTIRNRIVIGDNVMIAFLVAANPSSASRTGRLAVTPYRFGIDDEGAGALAPVTITVVQSGAP